MHLWHIGGGSREWSRSPNLFSSLDSHNIVNHFLISTSQERSNIMVKHFITMSYTLNPLFQHSCKSCKQNIIKGVEPHFFVIELFIELSIKNWEDHLLLLPILIRIWLLIVSCLFQKSKIKFHDLNLDHDLPFPKFFELINRL